MSVLHIVEFIGTPNAIVHSFGMETYREAKKLLESDELVVLDFSGLKNVTSSFFNALVGNLKIDLGDGFPLRIQIEGVESDPYWKEKFDNAIQLATNSKRSNQIDDAIASLFE